MNAVADETHSAPFAKIDDVKSVVVADYVRELALENIPTNNSGQ
ncbi:hypothetical protein [Burkholderia sp. SRS-W-2-2016]|nr:hypothetical protein [Burkholderia sp. SRS-W-2-2016]